MAVIVDEGKAGQFGKYMASKNLQRLMTIFIIYAMVTGHVFGIMIGFNAARLPVFHRLPIWSGWISIGAEAVFLGLGILFLRILDGPTERLSRERMNWLRGAEMEGFVASYLNYLPDTWHVFHNIQVRGKGDIDHVLVGPGGMFCISTKSHRGTYSIGPNGTYLRNGKETDDLNAAQKMALQLKDRLTGILGDVTWIQPVLAVPLAYVDFDTKQRKAWVVHKDNLKSVFDNASEQLKRAEIARYAKAISEIARTAGQSYRPPEPEKETSSASQSNA